MAIYFTSSAVLGELIEYHRTLRFIQCATFIPEVPKLGISLHVRRQAQHSSCPPKSLGMPLGD
ncbi:hypothetical protein J3E68DRAFT_428245 [Trichoderma sp. SZMC 28012]